MQKTKSIVVLGSFLGALSTFAALKYQTGDYAAQDALVMHLDGICYVGANAPHNPNSTIWVNLADANNPANIASNSVSGWRNGSGYYFFTIDFQ